MRLQVEAERPSAGAYAIGSAAGVLAACPRASSGRISPLDDAARERRPRSRARRRGSAGLPGQSSSTAASSRVELGARGSVSAARWRARSRAPPGRPARRRAAPPGAASGRSSSRTTGSTSWSASSARRGRAAAGRRREGWGFGEWMCHAWRSVSVRRSCHVLLASTWPQSRALGDAAPTPRFATHASAARLPELKQIGAYGR